MSPIAIRLRRAFAEMSYAQRRALELQTGVSLTGPAQAGRRQRRQINRLEAAWAASEPPVEPVGCGRELTVAPDSTQARRSL